MRVINNTKGKNSIPSELDNLLDNIPFGVAVMQDGKYVYTNSLGARLHGFSGTKDLLGKKGTFDIDEAYLDVIEDRIKHADSGIPNKPVYVKLNRHDGSKIMLESFSFPIKWHGKQSLMIMSREVQKLSQEEKALRTSEERFHGFFYHSPVGLAMFDSDFRYLMINNVLAEINNKSIEEHIGSPIGEIVPYYAEQAIPKMKEALSSGKSTDFEISAHSIINPLIIRSFRGSYFPLPGPTGSFEYIGAIISEITEQKNAEEKLKASEEKFRISFQNSIVGIVIADQDHHFIYSNPKWSEMTGYSSKEIIGKTIREFTHPDDVLPTMKLLTSLEEGKIKEFRIEKRYLRKDGSIFWGQLHVSAFHQEPAGTIHFLAVIVDITDRINTEHALKLNERKFRNFIEQSSEGIVICDKYGRIVEWNNRMQELFGIPKEHATGQKLQKIEGLNLQSIKGNGKNVLKLLSSYRIGKKGLSFPIRRIECSSLINHKKNLIEISGFRIIGEEDEEYHARIFRDITLQKRAEESVRRSERKLKDLNATKDRLFSIIGHDLRNPFNSILGFTQLMKVNLRTLSFERLEEYNQIIYQSASQAYGLLENLLNWSMSQSGRLIVTPEDISLRLIYSETEELIQSQLRVKNISILSNFSDELFINADPKMIRLVLRNLLTNAIKFSYQNGVIRVEATTEGKMVQICISDNGTGIAPADQKKIFNLVKKPIKEGTMQEKGSGLGLPLSREFVKRNGGKIWVLSSTGEGSSFYFTLPLAKS